MWIPPLLQHSAGHETILPAPPSSEQKPHQSHFLRLPPELRQLVYSYYLTQQHESLALLQTIYSQDLPKGWAEGPLPLLLLNKEISAEVSDLLQHSVLRFRVTGQGIGLYTDGPSVSLAQNVKGEKLGLIRIDIWPPHPDRPIEMLYIWDGMRKLRNKLARYVQIKRIEIRFVEHHGFAWTERISSRDYRRLLNMLPSAYAPEFLGDSYDRVSGGDMGAILNLFGTLTNAKSAKIVYPKSFEETMINEALEDHIIDILDVMTGARVPFITPMDLDSQRYAKIEKDLKQKTAREIQRSLDNELVYADLHFGSRRISEDKYNEITRRQPYFETLPKWTKFKGKKHYVHAAVDNPVPHFKHLEDSSSEWKSLTADKIFMAEIQGSENRSDRQQSRTETPPITYVFISKESSNVTDRDEEAGTLVCHFMNLNVS
ncbi:MAG: hypothetical protein Q9209_005537 [Squamulea sp. 1 TL-2023]